MMKKVRAVVDAYPERMTVGEVYTGGFRIFLIPHTLDNTTLKERKPGDYINVEFDMIGKYTEKQKKEGSLTKDFLKERGFV